MSSMDNSMKDETLARQPSTGSLSHIDESGAAHMVDVSGKAQTVRGAVAQAIVSMSADAFKALAEGNNKKGDVLGVARVAGIQAAKQTSQLIPLCHPLFLSKVKVDLDLDESHCHVLITATCQTTSVTGVEMEALTAASVAALTVYDMCKAIDREMVISDVYLARKSGGRSGDFHHPLAGS